MRQSDSIYRFFNIHRAPLTVLTIQRFFQKSLNRATGCSGNTRHNLSS